MTALVRVLGAEAYWELDVFPLQEVFPNPQQTPICRKLGENRGWEENSHLSLLHGAGRALHRESSEVL